jgi:7-carboxy-7-deazaguanine synthase
MLEISEIYETIQGETTRVGTPCVIVRLARCGLRCSWCDTEDALDGGELIPLEETLTRILASPLPLVILTGGEPLRQAETLELARRLLEAGRDLLVETNGVEEIGLLDERAIVIMDIKCPSSGESGKTLVANIERLRPTDEVKFVIATREDYAWAKAAIERHDLARRAIILFSWANAAGMCAAARIGLAELAEAIVRDRLPVRVIPQLHKAIWGDDVRGR